MQLFALFEVAWQCYWEVFFFKDDDNYIFIEKLLFRVASSWLFNHQVV